MKEKYSLVKYVIHNAKSHKRKVSVEIKPSDCKNQYFRVIEKGKDLLIYSKSLERIIAYVAKTDLINEKYKEPIIMDLVEIIKDFYPMKGKHIICEN